MEPWLIGFIIIFSLLVLLFTGLPVAFSLVGLSSLLFLLLMGPTATLMVVAAAFRQVGTEVFIAIPLFVLMAAVLQFSGIATSLYKTMHIWFGPLRGGLAIGTVFICAILDAMSGIGATATTTMGIIALPVMVEKGYNRNMVMGSIAAGGALGLIIPPSVLMIIVGGYAELSVGKLFLGGILPGLLITISFAIYIGGRCLMRPQDGPPIAKAEQENMMGKLKSLGAIIVPVAFILFIMVGIYVGVFTPTEASGFGALGAIIISIVKKKFTISNMFDALRVTLRVCNMIMWLLIGGGCYSALITVTGTGKLVSGLLAALPFNWLGFLIVMLCIPLVMGMFIDPLAITMICVPIFRPILEMLSIDIFWFMLLFILALVIGYITPPFGINIFYMKGVAPSDVRVIDIYRGTIPYAIIEIVILALCIAIPEILTFLPNMLS